MPPILGKIKKYRFETEELLFVAFYSIFFANLLPFSFFKLIFLLPIFLFVYLFDVSLKAFGFACLFSFTLLFLQRISILQTKTTYLSFFNSYLNLNDWVCKKIDSFYDLKTSDFIKALVFNYKKSSAYKSVIDLGISHLMVVSGMHISWIKKFIVRGFKTKNLFIFGIFIYWSFLGFTIPVLRVILGLLFGGRNKYRAWSICTLISPIFNVGIYRNVSFLLSFLISLALLLNKEFNLNRLNNWIFNFLWAFVCSSALLLPYTKELHVNSFLFFMLFGNLIFVLYLYFLFSWFLLFLEPLHSFLANLFFYLFEKSKNYSISLRMEFWDFCHSWILMSILALIFFICLYRCLNFTFQKI